MTMSIPGSGGGGAAASSCADLFEVLTVFEPFPLGLQTGLLSWASAPSKAVRSGPPVLTLSSLAAGPPSRCSPRGAPPSPSPPLSPKHLRGSGGER